MFGLFFILAFGVLWLNSGLSSSAWEWAAIISIDEGDSKSLVWNAEKVGGSYAESLTSMKFLVYPALSGSENGFHEIESDAETIFSSDESAAAKIYAVGNDSIPVGELSVLIFDPRSWISTFRISLPTSGFWAIYTEHLPGEFEDSNHYLKFSSGQDIEPSFVSIDDHDHEDETSGSDSGRDSDSSYGGEWGKTIPATLTVWMCSCIGLLFLVLPNFAKYQEFLLGSKFFAAGALLSTAFSLVLLEASHLIADKDGVITEAQVSGYWAAMVLCGFTTPMIADFVLELFAFGWDSSSFSSSIVEKDICSCDVSNGNNIEILVTDPPAPGNITTMTVGETRCEECVAEAEAAKHGADVSHHGHDCKVDDDWINSSPSVDTSNAPQKYRSHQQLYEREKNRQIGRILSSVIIGDFFHNFCDGIFIGAAFQSCSTTVGWTVGKAT